MVEGRTLGDRRFISAVLLASIVAIGGCLPPPDPTPGDAPSGSRDPADASTPAAGSATVPGSQSAASFDACGLITPAALSSILGGPPPVAEALPGGGWVAGRCAWKGPLTNFLVSVGTPDSIAGFGDPGGLDAAAKLNNFRELSTAAGKTSDIPGLGEGAVLGTTGLAASIGGHYLEIVRSTLTDDQLIAVARELAAALTAG